MNPIHGVNHSSLSPPVLTVGLKSHPASISHEGYEKGRPRGTCRHIGRGEPWHRLLVRKQHQGNSDSDLRQHLHGHLTSTETSVFTQGILVPTSSASTLNPLTGLSLDLNLSVINEVQVVVTAYEFNTLDRVNNVTYGHGSLLNSSFFQWANCDFGAGGMVGYEVLEGDYGPDNYTRGAALWLELQPSVIGAEGCADINLPVGEPVPSQDYHYAFSPLNDQNVLSGTYVGYWTDPSDASTYQPFPSGVYTVVAADEWGQVAILHFIVAG